MQSQLYKHSTKRPDSVKPHISL